MTKPIRLLIAVTALIPLALVSCSDAPQEGALSTLRDQAAALEQDHYDRTLRLDAPVAIRDETTRYAQAMHAVLEDLEDVCDAMYHGDMMMGWHSEDAVHSAMGQMHGMVEEHHRRMEAMDDLPAMRAECEEHHRLMGGGMADLDEAMAGAAGMHRSH